MRLVWGRREMARGRRRGVLQVCSCKGCAERPERQRNIPCRISPCGRVGLRGLGVGPPLSVAGGPGCGDSTTVQYSVGILSQKHSTHYSLHRTHRIILKPTIIPLSYQHTKFSIYVYVQCITTLHTKPMSFSVPYPRTAYRSVPNAPKQLNCKV